MQEHKHITFPEAARLTLLIEAAAQGRAFQCKLHYTHTGPTSRDRGNIGASEVRRFLSEEQKPLATDKNASAVKRLVPNAGNVLFKT